MAKDFFVSYNRNDHECAVWIAEQLKDHGGYSVIIQAWDFKAGSNFILGMHSASGMAERTIAVLSPDYLSAQFTQPEWAAAFAQDPTGEKGLLVPVRVRECQPGGLLRPIVYIDLVGLDAETARARLLEGVRRHQSQPETSTGSPQPETSGPSSELAQTISTSRVPTSFKSRRDLFEAVSKLLLANHIVFERFGPESGIAVTNPLSDAAGQWSARKMAVIIPNNQRIVDLLTANATLLTHSEYKVFLEFREHAEAFATSAHKRMDRDAVPRFPVAFESVVAKGLAENEG